MPIPVGSGGSTAPGSGRSLQASQAILSAVTFGAVDDFGTEVWLTDVTGWTDGVGSTDESEQKSGEHGAWVDPAYWGPRIVELSLQLLGTSEANVRASIARIKQAIPLDVPAALTVIDGEALTADVRQSGQVLARRRDNTAEMSISLIAPDPRRYGVMEESATLGLPDSTGGLVLPLSIPVSVGVTVVSGRATMLNEGNVTTPVTLEVAGPTPAGWQVTNLTTGQSVTGLDDVPSGHVLVVDSAAKTSLLDGTSHRNVTGAWLDAAVGLNEFTFTAPTADPASSVTVRYRAAWI